SDDIPSNGLNSNVLFLKMLKSSVLRTSPYPAWDLMMKNIYNIGYGLESDGFFLDIMYESGTSAGKINYLPDGPVKNVPLIQVTGVDRLTNNTAPNPDNFFDYVEGITVKSDRGLIIFPVLEPFGDRLAERLDNDPNFVDKYVFNPLYDGTVQDAIQKFPQLNRYTFEGFYRSAGGGAEIQLNTFNLSSESVVVKVGGRTLAKGVDYQIDEFGGKITFLNTAVLSSGQEIEVCFESSALYQVQTKILSGARAEFSPSQNLVLGATIMNLKEQPFTQKTILGEEPVSNTLWGIDASFRKESDYITKMLDRLPLITTKETSTIDAAIETAQFIPGQPRVVRTADERGIVYLDDFEAAANPYSLQGLLRWRLASYPEDESGELDIYDPTDFYTDARARNFSRGKLSWYQIDQIFYQNARNEIPESNLSENYTRQVRPNEIFPTATRAFGQNIQPTFDLSFQPAQRGPYNYQADPNKIDPATGLFTRPEESWGGITREMDVNNDFEATNIEFVEFWLMDPFMDDPNSPGGDFYINLGLVNEDVLDDEGLSQEHGLPGATDTSTVVQPTAYGNVPVGNPPTQNFSNVNEDRVAQDVGYDGLSNEDERDFFQTNFLNQLQGFLSPAAFEAVQADPSSDDFVHFRADTFSGDPVDIRERYDRFNGMEGNSPIGDNTINFTRTGQQTPDTEDLNGNGSLNFAEQYWEYKISMRPQDLERGQNFVVDKIDTTITSNGVTVPVTWYQFRVPLTSGRAVNGITNFKTISFMRMYMANFPQPIIMRMTEFQLIASNWRRFADDLSEPGVILPNPEPPFTDFELGTVSLEENSQKLPFNYSIPPGIIQQAINGNTAAGFLQDERSLVLKACNLEDGDARGIFRVMDEDLRLYERLKMWVHAEAVETGVDPSNFNEKGDARMFIRLGLDNDQNYYEYEWPLTPSDPALGASSVENVWLEDNEMDIELSLFAAAKADRNNAGTGLIYRHAYRDTSFKNDEVMYIKGTPKLSDVRNIMVGIRNPSDLEGQPICIEAWINELRLTDFDQQKGYGVNANASFNLGGFANISATGSYRSAGFGPLEQKLSERPQEDVLRWDLAGQLDLDRFFPKRWGLQMPVYATWGEQRIDPQFNPQEADVRTDRLIETLDREAAREKLQEIQDYQRTRSIAFNNWRKQNTRGQNQQGGVPAAPTRQRPNAGPTAQNAVKSYPWDISNFDFSFAYSETFARSAIIEKRFTTQYRGGINYRYNFPQVSLQPFKNVKKSQFLSGMQFNPLPTSIAISLNGDRQFEERIMRPTSLFGGITDPTFSKNFLINRNYNLTWNFSRNLQLNYTANNVARVDEVRSYWEAASQQERDSVGSLSENLLKFGKDPLNGHDQLVNFGRTTNFTHNLSVGFQLPTQNIKPLNWISGTVNYTGSFQWQQAPEINPGLGSTISNGQRIQANGRLDLNSLYRKFKPFKAILDEQSRPVSTRELEEKRKAKLDGPRTRAVDPELPPSMTQSSADGDSTENDPFKALKFIGRELGRIALSVRSLDVTYNRDASTILPGYLPRTDNFGLDWEWRDPISGNISPMVPPTWGYVFGDQADVRPIAGQNNWITRDTTLANLFMRNNKESITARTSVELFKGFRVDLNATRSIMLNESEFFRWEPSINGYASFDPLNSGNFSMSYIFANTAFKKSDLESFETFKLFSDTRQIVSRRYATENPNLSNLSRSGLVQGGFQNGYLGTQQDVLITSFLAAYGARDAENVELTPFPILPLPNWSINYNGLNNLPFIKEYFNSFTFRHAYRATYQIGNYTNNLNALLLGGAPFALDTVGTDVNGDLLENFFSEQNIQIASINEQFSPFIGLNFGLKNGVTGQLDYKKGRQLSLSLGSMQLTELRNEDFSLMVGYRKDKLNLQFSAFGRDFDLQNSANFQLRATVRDTREITRYLGDESLADTRP
ncbi:MAG: cell surface protein SprA, partial [Bacteroidota bacterium]